MSVSLPEMKVTYSILQSSSDVAICGMIIESVVLHPTCSPDGGNVAGHAHIQRATRATWC